MITPPYPPPPGTVVPPPGSRRSRFAALAIRILWTALPFLTIGLAAWVPSLVVAIRRRTLQNALWSALFVAMFAAYMAMVILVPEQPTGEDGIAQAAGGFFTVIYMVGAALHAWFMNGNPHQVVQQDGTMPTVHGYAPVDQRPVFILYPHYDQPPPYVPPTFPGHQPQYGQQPQPQPQAPLSSHMAGAAEAAEAAQVQAELRELRGLLEEGRA